MTLEHCPPSAWNRVRHRVEYANGHDPYAYLKDVLTRLPTHKASRIEELLPHRWQPAV